MSSIWPQLEPLLARVEKPARYMGRIHWVTIVSVAGVPEEYLRELVEWSYGRALASLSKTQQREIHAAAL